MDKISKIKKRENNIMETVCSKKRIVYYLMLLIIITLVVIIFALIKREKNRDIYNLANENMKLNNYEKSIDLFSEINSYKDSEYKILEAKYDLAVHYYQNEDYENAKILFNELVDYFDSDIYLSKIDAKLNEPDITKEVIYQEAISLYEKRNYQEALSSFETISDYKDSNAFILSCKAIFKRNQNSHHIAGGIRNSITITNKGTIKTAGKNGFKQLNTNSWNDIISVDIYGTLTIGLQENGVAKITGTYNKQEIYDLEIWNDLVDVAAGEQFVVGLKSNGTVIADGHNGDGQLNVETWNNVTDIDAGARFTVALTEDKQLLFTGYCGKQVKDFENQKEEWRDVISISASGGEKGGRGKGHTVGLKSDRTLVAVGDNSFGQCDFSDTEKWSDIVKVATGDWYTVGLKSDGSVVMTGENFSGCKYIDEDILNKYRNIVDIAAGYGQTMLLTEDGEIICFGFNDEGKDQLNGFKGAMIP